MATSTLIICSLCQEDNETSTAVTWCAECESKRILSNLHENLKTIKLFFSENLSALEKQKLEAISRVHTMRQSINNHLDKLEESLLDDIGSEFTNLQETIGNIKSEIDSKTDQVEEKQKDFSKMVEFLTDLQTYFGLHEVEKVIKQEEQLINKLKSADKLSDKKMKVDCFDLDSTVRCTKEFAKLSIYLSPEKKQKGKVNFSLILKTRFLA
ncbi:Hypothetical predicted protein [Mytilus galloprovincialis]|uniref:Uncharacterized protein n=1 Tax=Mytilus galloprovincialis TaxID=29158 RepID=A0A8B6BV57_MYTGA|nr:Hypothetical predicted protein [Mytilus galloprovincialis]